METITLKELALEIKELILNNHNLDVEKYSYELAERSGLDFSGVKNLYNLLFEIYNIEPVEGRKYQKWTKCEDDFIVTYVSLHKYRKNYEKNRPAGELLDDLAIILDSRTPSAISFRYYHVLEQSKRIRGKPSKPSKSVPETPIEVVEKQIQIEEIENDARVENSIIERKIEENRINEIIIQKPKKQEDGDLLGVVVETIQNVEKADVDVTTLFKSILTLSKKAVENNGSAKKIEILEAQLIEERKENELLREDLREVIKDMEALKKEISDFNDMNGKDKLLNLQGFNDRVGYIVDRYGMIVKA